MKILTLHKKIRALLGVALLGAACLTARANDTVFFAVDLNEFTNSSGTLVALSADVRGAFNGWSSGWTLVNNGAGVFTNTFTVTGNPGDQFQYKFTMDMGTGVNWEDNNPPPGAGQPADAGNNRVLQLVGGAQTLPSVPFYSTSLTPPFNINAVTFQVDMTRFTNGSGAPAFSICDVRGSQNGWGGGSTLNRVGSSGIYTGTFAVVGSAGSSFNYKFTFTSPGGVTWEDNIPGSPNNNRNATLVGGPQTLPLVTFYSPNTGTPLEYETTNVQFQVDMRAQGDAWLAGGGSITVSGYWNGWNGGDVLTNNSTATYPTNWFYKSAYTSISFQKWFPGFPPSGMSDNTRYKFRANAGWEEPTTTNPTGNNDRYIPANGVGIGTLNSDNVVVRPMVSYSDAGLCDVLEHDYDVTVQVHVPNGVHCVDGHVFDNTVDAIYVNGPQILGAWQPWNFLLPQMLPAGNDIYTNHFIVGVGQARQLQFKFSVGGPDNENGFHNDHFAWIRGTNASLTMDPVEFGTNFTSTLVQPRFGNLAIGKPVAGQVPVTWLGCACVTLQTKATLNGNWTDLGQTDGTSSTNMPASGTGFFRLYNRPNP